LGQPATPVAWPAVQSAVRLAWVGVLGVCGATVILAFHPYSPPLNTIVQFGSTALNSAMLPIDAALVPIRESLGLEPSSQLALKDGRFVAPIHPANHAALVAEPELPTLLLPVDPHGFFEPLPGWTAARALARLDSSNLDRLSSIEAIERYYRLGAGVEGAVDAMPEAGDLLAGGEHVADLFLSVIGVAAFQQQLHHVLVRAAVQWAVEGGDRRGAARGGVPRARRDPLRPALRGPGDP